VITESDILSALRGVLDPEMPINIVDLGMVEGIDLQATEPRSHEATEGGQQGTGKRAARTDHVRSARVRVDILPTFVGCPALDMIRDDIRDRLLSLPGVQDVSVRFLNNPLWSTDRITEAGRASLKQHGVTVPTTCRADGATTRLPEFVPLTVSRPNEPSPCPFCDSPDTILESRFGPTRCRTIYYCPSCKNSFERLKRI
jgi:ring-1,2-phenylacetyl-CoA epoxidase subunit PaaD